MYLKGNRKPWRRRLGALLAILLASACLPRHGPQEPPPAQVIRTLTAAQVASLIPPDVPERLGWARDVQWPDADQLRLRRISSS